VGKRENAGNAVAHLNDGAISAIPDAFDRIGERFAIEPARIGENIGDRYRAKIIKLKDHAGPQDALAPLFGHGSRFIGVHAAADGFLDMLRDEGFPRRFGLFAEHLCRGGLEPL
jgi:hypothetical protein